jgi:hypothetical protein
MPRFSTVVFLASILIVAFNLIPSSRYVTSIQDKHSKQNKNVEVQDVASSTIDIITTAMLPLSSSKMLLPQLASLETLLTSANTITAHPSTLNTSTDATQILDGARQHIKEAPSTRSIVTFRSSFSPTMTNISLSQFLKETQQHLIDSATTTAWSNVSTYSFGQRHLISGYRNQIMSLTMLMMKANDEGHEQFLLDSLQHKDTYGTNQFVPFEVFFDVEHWNSFYNAAEYRANQTHENWRHPVSLPRLVYHDPKLHHQWDRSSNSFIEAVWNGSQVPTHPFGYLNPSTRLQMTYQRYVKGKTKYRQPHKQQPGQQHLEGQYKNRSDVSEQSQRNPAEILMLQGALKPHPTLQSILESLLEQMKQRANSKEIIAKSTNVDIDWSYMTLHARVEPDMQRHPVCKDKKVLYLRNIIQMIETKFIHPPVSIVFMPINRQYLEKEGTLPVNYKNDPRDNINGVAVDNLRELNRLIQFGMWNGTVPVVEFGANALKGTVYQHRPSTAGAILNFFLTLQPQCRIFVGTPVSSFSHDVLASRFYRGYRHHNNYRTKTLWEYENYQYLPEGLVDWISSDMVDSPGFLC